MQQIEYQRLRAEGLEVQTKATRAVRARRDRCRHGDARRLQTQAQGVEARRRQPSPGCSGRSTPATTFKLLKREKEFDERTSSRRRRSSTEEMIKEAERRDEEAAAGQGTDEAVQRALQGRQVRGGRARRRQKAHELDPDDPSTEAACKLAEIHGGHERLRRHQNARRRWSCEGLNDAERSGPGRDTKNPVAFDMSTMKIAKGREKDKNGISMRSMRREGEGDQRQAAEVA